MTGPFAGKRVLLISPAFVADRRHKRVHGVELFNFLFVRRLVEMGVRVTLAAEPRWKAGFEEHLAGVGDGLDVIYGMPLKRPLAVSLSLVPKMVKHGPYDLVVLGNNGRGILPAVKLLQRFGKRKSPCMLFAHQYANAKYLKQLRAVDLSVHCVSEAVAADFRAQNRWPVSVGYGILNGEKFFPRDVSGGGADGSRPLRFGVVGKLDTPWKGAHLAIEAWEKLPASVRGGGGKAELHMLAYSTPPAKLPAGVVLHDWLPLEKIPEFMRTLDVLIVPSTSAESFSQVSVQGMLTGLPLLVYPIPVLTEKIDAGGGAAFSTPTELAGLVERCVLEPTWCTAMGVAARRTALERYCWSAEGFCERFLGSGGSK
ncbi:MAG: glycosyltransferase family 4 protein [Phycisphaerales bacterium]